MSNSVPSSRLPPSTSTFVIRRRPSSSSSDAIRCSCVFAGARKNLDAGRGQSLARIRRRVVAAATSTGTSAAVCTSRLSSDSDAAESTTIRVAIRFTSARSAGRAVSSGLSARAVPLPTMIASTRPRS